MGGFCRDTQREQDKSNKTSTRKTRLQARIAVLDSRFPKAEEWKEEGEGGDEEKEKRGRS
jgi:type II secretory pathway component PulJ